jgi:hypothetical protein
LSTSSISYEEFVRIPNRTNSTSCEVSSLAHEVGDDSVERWSLESESL